MKTRSYVLLFVLLGVTLSVLWMGQAASADKVIVGRDIREGDVVIGLPSSGVHSNGLTLARKALLERAGRSRLRVSGPFHSPAMAPVGEALERAFDTVAWSDADPPIVSNVTGEPVHEATRIRALAKLLGADKARVVGHDIGLMVAYAYAAQFPADVEKLVVMDAFLPGVGGWESVYNNPGIWHFRFNGPTPEALVRGRERAYFEHFWNDFAADKTRSIPNADRAVYTAAYAMD